jgi:predicted amino acid racemase
MYPKVNINLNKLAKNIQVVTELCQKHNIQITGITKMFCGDVAIAEVYINNGIHILGDARIDNLKKLNHLKAEKWLIRIPMVSEAYEIVRYSDVSLNSEWCTIEELNRQAQKQGKIHKIILMVDLGDIREGYVDYNEVIKVTEKLHKMTSLQLYGIATNLTCFSFVHPDTEKLTQLQKLSDSICYGEGQSMRIISGGNSATIDLMLKEGIPKGVNNLRLGEAILFGKERAHYKFLENTYSDIFILQVEIIEVKEKPSVPWGYIGVDSYGHTPLFEDKGIRVKAICAVGKQDIDIETMVPMDFGISILGASSDHLMLDITESQKTYEVGDIVEFKLGYFATMRAFTSQYVEKVYQD